jgi:hypothetical protein
MNNAIVIKDHQHEFAVVWQALNEIWQCTEPGDLLRLEVQRASDTLLHLMRIANCSEPIQFQDDVQATESVAASV